MNNTKIWASLHPFFEQGPALGRTEANRRFLHALVEADPFDAYSFFLPHPDDCERLKGELAARWPDMVKDGRFAVRLHREFPVALRECDYYCLHLSDPFVRYTDGICLRNAFSRRIFPVTAPTHSLSYAEYGPLFLHHMWPGVTSRDVLAATSTCGARAVAAYYSSLRGAYRLSAEEFPSPAVRIVPLGVEPALMPSPEEKDALGRQCRQQYGLGDRVVFLVFARLSYQSKMDLLPLLRACKRAEENGLRPEDYCLTLAGWLDKDDAFDKDIQRLAANLGICLRVVPRPDDAARKGLYAAADVFLSPSDNVQETFGLTVLEAALSGLPVVASDFDGYRDLVDDGESGFLIPSLGPAATPGTDCLARIVPAAEHHLLLAQQTAVDTRALGQAMRRLAADKTLRLRMGRAGRRRVLAAYTWRHIIKRYTALWAELNDGPCELPDNAAARPPKAVFHPACPPSRELFGHYFASRVDAPAVRDKMLVWSKAGRAVYHGQDFPVIYRLVERYITPDNLKKLLFRARRPISVASLRSLCREFLPDGVPGDEDFVLLWALKHDFLEFCPQPDPANDQARRNNPTGLVLGREYPAMPSASCR
ncbi:MAG: glycosyltransferase family 4 protein [Desulfovibrio sp.]|jgi:glycosyltransferase involved in cell wall biosynthesis|nr:glycosyltransferase family 4 protein [Desulfovibrio sp.]